MVFILNQMKIRNRSKKSKKTTLWWSLAMVLTKKVHLFWADMDCERSLIPKLEETDGGLYESFPIEEEHPHDLFL